MSAPRAWSANNTVFHVSARQLLSTYIKRNVKVCLTFIAVSGDLQHSMSPCLVASFRFSAIWMVKYKFRRRLRQHSAEGVSRFGQLPQEPEPCLTATAAAGEDTARQWVTVASRAKSPHLSRHLHEAGTRSHWRGTDPGRRLASAWLVGLQTRFPSGDCFLRGSPPSVARQRNRYCLRSENVRRTEESWETWEE